MKDIMNIITAKAKEKKQKIIISEGWDDRALNAVDSVLRERICDIILVGDEAKIKTEMQKLKLDFRAEIYDPKTYKKMDELVKELVELRKAKGMTEDKAKELLKDEQYFSMMLAHMDIGDGVAGSCICSTANFMRPALQIIKTLPGHNLVSEVAIMIDKKKDKLYFTSDSSLNVSPTADQLAEIAVNGGDCAQALGFEPKIALLSFSTKGSGGDGPEVQVIRDAAEIAQTKRPKYLIDGEYQVDAAIDPDAARRKNSEAPIQGNANVLVYPNLTAANITTHALMRFSELRFVYGFLMGMRKPVGIMGRSVDASHIKTTITIVAAHCNMF